MLNYIEKFSLHHKVAYVTGGLGLIGLQISHALATAGATTILLDIHNEKGFQAAQEIQAQGYQAHYELFDTTDLEAIQPNVQRLLATYQRMDVWVNCAYPRTADWGNKVEDLSLDSWRQNVDMQLNAYAWCSREVALAMKTQRSGAIINIGSVHGVVGADFSIYEGTLMTSPMAYAAIKGGIVNLTRYLASYFGEYQIRVNTVCPGGIFDHQNPVFVKNYERKTPLKRMGKPEEVASTVLFLASDAAAYITGATMMVDGGWTAT